MQSTGQGGPEVNRDLEVLFGRLNDAIRELNALRATQDAITGGSGGSPPPPGGDGGTSGGTGDVPFLPVYESSATTIYDQGTGTEDSWQNNVSAGAPSGARFAIVQFQMNSDTDTDDYDMNWRTESGAQEILVGKILPGADSDSGNNDVNTWYFVKLTASGTFDYRVNSNAGSLNWSIKRLGYSM